MKRISKERINLLNSGKIETRNLTEWLAIDQSKLLTSLSKSLKSNDLFLLKKNIPKVSIPKQIAWIGENLSDFNKLDCLKKHPSDMVRCWVCYAIVKNKNLKQSLNKVKPFARDDHFGVREVAWMSIREKICENPKLAISLLKTWAKEKDKNVRRFACEATRPRGVWAKHIVEFKKDPSPALPLLNCLFKDDSRYVQDSVGNWLNDSAKDRPDWVKSVVAGWKQKSDKKETDYIVRRATRSIH